MNKTRRVRALDAAIIRRRKHAGGAIRQRLMQLRWRSRHDSRAVSMRMAAALTAAHAMRTECIGGAYES